MQCSSLFTPGEEFTLLEIYFYPDSHVIDLQKSIYQKLNNLYYLPHFSTRDYNDFSTEKAKYREEINNSN